MMIWCSPLSLSSVIRRLFGSGEILSDEEPLREKGRKNLLLQEDCRFVLNNSEYLALDGAQLPWKCRHHDTALVTVIKKPNGQHLSKHWMKLELERLSRCDVYQQDGFLNGILVTNVSSWKSWFRLEVTQYLHSLGARWCEFVDDQKITALLRPGPYLYIGGVLKPVFRIRTDINNAFQAAVYPTTTVCPGADLSQFVFKQLPTASLYQNSLGIATAPRSWYDPTSGEKEPLRIAIKDCYFLKGMENSLGNRSYYSCSVQASFTALVVRRLLEDNAQILGFTKLSSMISREEPMESVDFHAVFNPRGDGYQSPAGSSSGSAAAVAAYDWVDAAIGTDTSGSGRRPALVNGVWEFRPSHKGYYLDGMITTYTQWDTPCVFARSLSTLTRVARAWSHSRGRLAANYKIVFIAEYFSASGKKQRNCIYHFVQDMQKYLSAPLENLSITDRWELTHPQNTPKDLRWYLDGVVEKTYYYSFFHATDKFRERFVDKNHGSEPYVTPYVQDRWRKGEAVSEEEYKEAESRLQIYKNWLLDNIFSVPDTSVLVVLPIQKIEPNYRDEVKKSPTSQSALDELFLVSILGSPDVVVPIGEWSYPSKITGKKEYLPIAVNIVGAPDTDLQLLDAVDHVMTSSGRRTEVLPGSRMFPHRS
ncbi:amidase signature domain-containing protein [Durotheca rogersii]|uniref:amidase signature domain-containing protein n=1 Tax=Durotheca rogersii TaxID=419775 RepID=UPI00221ED0AD|nr:amidase signature domain-containing protein [Durotheca rogersii]KAI5853293.1 amidase signature domain-containing protein [Durotheca rogersii]